MTLQSRQLRSLGVQVLAFLVLSALAFWVKQMEMTSDWQLTGLTTFSMGFVLLGAFIAGQLLAMVKLPMLTGYIFMGILAGPYVTGFLDPSMVERLRIVDDLALSFIALIAGGTLNLAVVRTRVFAIAANVVLLTLLVFVLVFFTFQSIHRWLNLPPGLDPAQSVVLALLLGVIAVARSPSSAIAIINECRASGTFTTTVLGVTIVMDVLIIVLFTLAMTGSRFLLGNGNGLELQTFAVLSLAVFGSLLIGAVLGKAIAWYMEKVGHDLPLFLLFFAFGVFKASEAFNHFMESRFEAALHLEPLLICISAGFMIQNFSKCGRIFLENMERVSLPVYVLFFSLAGAALNLEALMRTWPLAIVLFMSRALAIFAATWSAGTIAGDPPLHRRMAWMAYLTQAGVSIGLAQMARKQFPELGAYLSTLVLAAITFNQVLGPVTFKLALNRTGEAKKRR